MTELYELEAADAEVFVLAHIFPAINDVDALGSKKWVTGGPLPYTWAKRVAGPDDEDLEIAVVRVRTIDTKYTDAMRLARVLHRRMKLLVRNPSYPVVLPNGREADLEYCETLMGPTEVPYSAESVATCVMSEYRLALSNVAV